MKRYLLFCVLGLLPSFLPTVGFAQLQAAKLDLWVERSPVTETAKYSCGKQRVLMMAGPDRFGFVTETDTLALVEYPSKKILLVNQLNDDIYTMMAIHNEGSGFIVFVTPLKNNFKHATHALTISTTNICDKKHHYEKKD